MLPDCPQHRSRLRPDLCAMLPRGSQAAKLSPVLACEQRIIGETLPGNGEPPGNRVHLGSRDAGVRRWSKITGRPFCAVFPCVLEQTKLTCTFDPANMQVLCSQLAAVTPEEPKEVSSQPQPESLIHTFDIFGRQKVSEILRLVQADKQSLASRLNQERRAALSRCAPYLHVLLATKAADTG
jgi:hypothetical protein